MLNSKDVIILITGFILSIIGAVAFSYLVSLDQISLIFVLITLLTLLILGVAWVLYKKIIENEEVLSVHEVEQKRLGEKLKIHEQLIDVKMLD